MIHIRPFVKSDWPFVKAIYQQGIDTKNATFQEETKEWPQWDASVSQECRLVAERDGRILGWAALSPTSNRPVYAGVAEVSVYVATDDQGQGIGTRLLLALIEASERTGIWTLQAGIFPENVASVALHEKCGFRIVGIREKLGKMEGRWRDVLLLERRSKVVGV
jgi:phosphinothricin acetyltransferase